MQGEKSVSFSHGVQVRVFDSRDDPANSDFIRESSDRTRMERLFVTKPSSELERVRNVFNATRDRSTSVLFGNLGRQPHLLNFFLDMCFGYRENVAIMSDWKLPSDYQITEIHEPLDFLFVVEPYFGYSILKPSSVKHLIVLSSHVSFANGADGIYSMHLSSFNNERCSDPHLQKYQTIQPPVFHENPPPFFAYPAVVLDVSKSRTIHEAYLRLLTGREMVWNRPFKIEMKESDKQLLTAHLESTKRQIKNILQMKFPTRWKEKYSWYEKVYWNF